MPAGWVDSKYETKKQTMMSPVALGVDFGEARVGVAASDDLGMMAHPVETIRTKDTDPIDRLAELVVSKKAATVVLGMPRNMDGSYGPAADKVRAFAEQLRARIAPVAVVFWDERMSTISAARSLHAAGKNAKAQKGMIDQAAAQVILQSWMDASQMGTPGTFPGG